MKNFKLIFAIIILAILVVAFKSIGNFSTAEVEQVDGLYIFTDSKPVNEYKIIGEVKMGFGTQEKPYFNIRKVLIEKTKKTYPTAEGIIITHLELEKPIATVIDFKD